MKTLSMQRPLPSMLIVTSCRLSTPVKSSLVNWLPWSVLKISGRPRQLEKQHCLTSGGRNRMFSLYSIADGRKMAVQGERIPGGFILITGLDGIRYAVRPQSIGIIHDADECRDETLVQLHGGHVVRVPCPLDEERGWFKWRSGRSGPHVRRLV